MKLSQHPLYQTWDGMVRRCRDPRNKNYARWGGSGIDCLDEWAIRGRHGTTSQPPGFISFLKYVDENLGPKPEGFTLDRIRNTDGYYPGNIRWANMSLQNANRTFGDMRNIRQKPNGKFQVNIRYNKQVYYLGTYDIIEEAVCARDQKWAELLGG